MSAKWEKQEGNVGVLTVEVPAEEGLAISRAPVEGRLYSHHTGSDVEAKAFSTGGPGRCLR